MFDGFDEFDIPTSGTTSNGGRGGSPPRCLPGRSRSARLACPCIWARSVSFTFLCAHGLEIWDPARPDRLTGERILPHTWLGRDA
jgi:hypothetical protein